MELTTVLGIIVGIGGILLGNLIEGGHVATLGQAAAAVIVLSGTCGAVMISCTREDIRQGLRMLRWVFSTKYDPPIEKIMSEILDCAKIAKKESIMALEQKVPSLSDPFLQRVLTSVIDGTDPEILKDLFYQQIHVEESRLLSGAKVWTDAGGYSPTIGILGAVLGLIHVMSNLSDTSKLGSGIAVAFVATIYGVGLANLLFLPVGNKIKKKISQHMNAKELIVEGCLSIHKGLNTLVVEQKIEAFVDQEGSEKSNGTPRSA